MVLGPTEAAVEILVQRSRRAAGDAGDDEPSIGTLWAGLDACDDALGSAPAGSAVVERFVARQLVRAGGGGLLGRSAALQSLDMAAQRRGRGHAENEIHTVGAAEIQHLGRAVVAVGTEQDLDPRPVAADLAHQAAEEATHLLPGRPARRTQQGGHRTALAVEHDDRLEAILVVVGVEQPQLLAAVHGVEGVVDIERDATRHLAEAGALECDHGLAHAQQVAWPRQVLEARDGWL